MRSKKKLFIIGILLIAFVAILFIHSRGNSTIDYSKKYADVENLNANVEGLGRDNTYAKYLESHENTSYPSTNVEVNIADYSDSKGVELLSEYEEEQNVLLTSDDSYVEWQVEIPETGMYQMYMEYYPVESRGVDVERKFYINGSIPFLGADGLTFSRLWVDKNEVKQDNQGNDIRPTQVENPKWTGSYFKDDLGYYSEPYTFYFEKGTNEVALESVNEPIAIKSVTLCAVKENTTYEDYRAKTPEVEEIDEAKNYKEVVQGEDSVLRSSPSLYATYDRSSPNTEPYSVSKISLNMTGGVAWRVPGQWIEWQINVPADGYYNLSIKGRQNYNRGFVSNREVYIDGKIPFFEASRVSFQYSNVWQLTTLSDENKDPYEIYLEKGTHTVRLEVTLGELGNILNDMQDSVYRLNEIYRKILVLTGTTPDTFRDYKIDKVYPEVIEGMKLESKRLYKILDEIIAYSGQKAGQGASIETLAKQLETFVKNPEKIPKTFSNFKDNIVAFGSSVLTLSEAPLDIDYIEVTGVDAKIDKVKDSFAGKTLHELQSFIASFTTDYNSLGDVYKEDESIEVWILSGRDQSTILKTMIDDTFTPESGININVKLVEAGTLLNAVIAGTGPDVVLSVGQGEPVNYALRNAVEDLTQFEDCEDVLKQYYESAYEPFRFDGGLYGLPETQNFNVLFYRTDIMEELEIEIPQTWDDLISILPIIQQNNMGVAIPSTERTLNNVSSPDLSTFFALLYQNGGTVYNEEGKKSLIDEESGIKSFELFTRLFTNYKLPTIYDFPNRFRSGEMPIGIADYSMFNTLVVFAPEIRGLWDFTLIPGTLQEDGTIDRSCHTTGACSMMLKQDNDVTKKKSWEFLKWWSSSDTQVRFGQEMESIMGASARYATANIEAFRQLSWSSDEMNVLEEQRKWAKGLREVAGGYYTSRHITNAIRKVINKNEDQRETLLDYARTINEEILKKRLEFGLDSK